MLVLRGVTEPPEVVEVGAGRIVGTSTRRIVEEASWLLDDSSEYKKISRIENSFRDRHAAERIVSILDQQLSSRYS